MFNDAAPSGLQRRLCLPMHCAELFIVSLPGLVWLYSSLSLSLSPANWLVAGAVVQEGAAIRRVRVHVPLDHAGTYVLYCCGTKPCLPCPAVDLAAGLLVHMCSLAMLRAFAALPERVFLT